MRKNVIGKIIFSILFLLSISFTGYGQFGSLKGALNKAKNKAENTAKGKLKNDAKNNNSSNQSETTEKETKKEDTSKSGASKKTYYVSMNTGSNRSDGSKSKPFKNIDKAFKVISSGDIINVAEGVYSGTFDIGYWEVKKDFELYGGFNSSFSERNPVKYPTLFQPTEDAFDKTSKDAMIELFGEKGTVIDGFIFEGGKRNKYSFKAQPEGVETGKLKIGPGSKTPETVFLNLRGSGMVVRNNVFVNGSFGALRVMVTNTKGGDVLVENNIFVANRMYGLQGYGTSGEDKTSVTINVKNNTFLFSWGYAPDGQTNGEGIDIQSNVSFHIENNLLAFNVGPGMSSKRFNTNIELVGNHYFGNKTKDFWFYPSSSVKVIIDATQFDDLELDVVEGNINENVKLPLDEPYLKGFMDFRYSESTDYDPNSQANLIRSVFGMNQVGTMTTSVSMFANKYPWKKTLDLFGAVSGKGAQNFNK